MLFLCPSAISSFSEEEGFHRRRELSVKLDLATLPDDVAERLAAKELLRGVHRDRHGCTEFRAEQYSILTTRNSGEVEALTILSDSHTKNTSPDFLNYFYTVLQDIPDPVINRNLHILSPMNMALYRISKDTFAEVHNGGDRSILMRGSGSRAPEVIAANLDGNVAKMLSGLLQPSMTKATLDELRNNFNAVIMYNAEGDGWRRYSAIADNALGTYGVQIVIKKGDIVKDASKLPIRMPPAGRRFKFTD